MLYIGAMETLIHYVKEYGYYVFLIAVILYFLSSRKPNVDRKKTAAIFYQSLFCFLLTLTAIAIDEHHLNPHLIWPALALVLGLSIYFRKHVYPYPGHCAHCGAVIPWKERWIAKNTDCSACRSTETTKAHG
ncbi:MAG: hypothetical protein JXR76_24010 [Deltaproteobacteria bacterium]|nr:hypothetical protein [Deltaproteobacteria bacterium]